MDGIEQVASVKLLGVILHECLRFVLMSMFVILLLGYLCSVNVICSRLRGHGLTVKKQNVVSEALIMLTGSVMTFPKHYEMFCCH